MKKSVKRLLITLLLFACLFATSPAVISQARVITDVDSGYTYRGTNHHLYVKATGDEDVVVVMWDINYHVVWASDWSGPNTKAGTSYTYYVGDNVDFVTFHTTRRGAKGSVSWKWKK